MTAPFTRDAPPGWVAVPFGSPALVSAGHTYALVLTTASTSWYVWAYASGDPYPNGKLWSCFPVPGCAWRAEDPQDTAFNTYVQADTTPPVVTPHVTGPLGSNGWYTGDVTVTWAVSDPESPILSSSGCDATAIRADTAGTTLTCTATSAGGTASQSVTIRRDATPPAVARDAAADDCSLPGDAGWCRGVQTAGFVAGDATSGLADPAQASFTRSTAANGGAVTIASGAVCDAAGNCAGLDAGPYRIDSVAPTLDPTVTPNPVPLGGSATASPNATDGLSGVASAGCGAPDTSSLVAKTGTGTATDKAGNSASATAGYQVTYTVCALYDQTAAHHAGSVVPIKLRLCDASGANQSSAAIVVTAVGLTKMDSTASGAVDDAGNANPDGGFRYDAALGGYIYNLSTKGLTTGTWRLSFTVAGDPVPHGVLFDVR